jgi:hypothetical protein
MCISVAVTAQTTTTTTTTMMTMITTTTTPHLLINAVPFKVVSLG